MMLPPAQCLRCRFAASLAALAHFVSMYYFKAAVSGTGKAQPCMILTPPPHAVWRAFRLLLYEIGVYSSVSLSVPFSLSLLIQGWRSAFFIVFTQPRSARRNIQPEQTFTVCEAVGYLKKLCVKTRLRRHSARSRPLRSAKRWVA